MAGERKRKGDGGDKILRGLDEALAWTRGETAEMVHLPGQPGRLMTRAEYEAAKAQAPTPTLKREGQS